MEFTTIAVAIISSGVLNVILSRLFAVRDRRKEESEVINQSLRLILKDRLKFLCMHYINQNWIYEDELEDLMAMHSCYHDDLKGNGFLDEMMDRVKSLEVRGPGR